MTPRELFDALVKAQKVEDVRTSINAFRASNRDSAEVPFGARPNNRGAIEVAADAARSVIERVTNGFDALLELEHTKHKGRPDCRSPREAAEAWLNAERERSPRADLQSAPGRLRASCPPVLRPVRGVQPLDWDRKERITPANCRVPGNLA